MSVKVMSRTLESWEKSLKRIEEAERRDRIRRGLEKAPWEPVEDESLDDLMNRMVDTKRALRSLLTEGLHLSFYPCHAVSPHTVSPMRVKLEADIPLNDYLLLKEFCGA